MVAPIVPRVWVVGTSPTMTVGRSARHVGNEAQLVPVLCGIAVVGLAVLAGYLWMAARWDRAEPFDAKA